MPGRHPLSEKDRLSEKSQVRLKLLISHLKPYKFQLFMTFISLFLAVSMVLSFGWGLKQLIDDGFATEDLYTLNLTIGIMVGAVILLAIASFGRSYFVSWIGERVVTDLRQKIFQHLLTLDVGFFELVQSGEMVSRLTTDMNLIQVIIGTSAAVAMRNSLLLLGGIVMMIITSAKLTLYSLAIIPFITIPIMIYGKRVRQLSQVTQDRIADLAGFIEEVLGSIRTAQAFMHENIDSQNFHRNSERSFQASVARIRIRGWLSCLVMMLAFGGVSVILWIGGEDVILGKMQPGDLSAFIFYAILVASAAGSFSEIVADLQRAAGATGRLQELLQTTPAICVPSAVRPLPIPAQGTIAFHNVTFAYPNNPQRPVLRNVTFSAAPGEKIAIVGPSGTGKSTILSLLLQFFSPQAGSIYIDGIDTRDASVEDIRCRMGLVPQDPMIFTKSLFENILYGRPDAPEDDVWKAAEAAHLLEVIDDLPQGIHSIVGSRGIRLSGGQKQRIAIARAILRDPAILLLDEATSALDAESEELIQHSLKPLMATRTTIVIAHRLATVLKADRIIVMNKGIVQAVGTHAELISEDGLYRRLAMMQFTDSYESRLRPAMEKILA